MTRAEAASGGGGSRREGGSPREGDEDLAGFAETTHRFLQGQITLADSKAAVVLTASTLVLVYLIRIGMSNGWREPLSAWGWDSLLASAAVLSLGVGITAALAVVVPRTRGSARGYVFWEAILSHESPERYAEAVLGLEASTLTTAILEDCHRLSEVCARKFAILRWSMWSASLGLFLTVVWLLLAP